MLDSTWGSDTVPIQGLAGHKRWVRDVCLFYDWATRQRAVSSQVTEKRQVSPCPCDGVVARRPMPRVDRADSLGKICCLLAECMCINYLISPLLSSPLRKYIVFSSAGKGNDEIIIKKWCCFKKSPSWNQSCRWHRGKDPGHFMSLRLQVTKPSDLQIKGSLEWRNGSCT